VETDFWNWLIASFQRRMIDFRSTRSKRHAGGGGGFTAVDFHLTPNSGRAGRVLHSSLMTQMRH